MKVAPNTYSAPSQEPIASAESAGCDPAIALEKLAAMEKMLNEKSSIIDKKSEVIEQQKERIAMLEEYLRLARAQRFGPSSEKNALQVEMLFNDVEALEESEEEQQAQQALEELKEITDTATPKKRGRKGLSKSLPRIQVHLALSEEEKQGAVDTFFTVVKEELDIQRPKAQVIEYLQEKAVFIEQSDQKDTSEANTRTDNSRRIVAAATPLHPLNKCIASIGLLCHIIVSKYCDGLSLYGLEKMLARYGGAITRTAMANWVIRLSGELQPLVNLAREYQLQYDYLQIDETRVQVLKEAGKSPHGDKWMWVSKGGPPGKPVVLFDYDPSRGAEVPTRLLEGFEGYLQCDGLSSYNAMCASESITRVGCFDHARRKFIEAIKAQPKGKKTKASVADIGLSKINALYRLERSIKELPAHEKYRQRQKIAAPLLKELKAWLESKAEQTLKDSLSYKAIYYTLNQWSTLIAYCDDGRLNISNAGAENAIRPFAVGRRRWLFCDTPAGANASAIHYSLIETAKANELSPDDYYAYILPKLPYAKTVEDWEALLPWNVKDVIFKNSEK